jgi:hypothetical protein
MDMGARVVFYQADIVLLKAGLEQVRRDMSPLGFAFDHHVSPHE